jgi:hypothetical protein
MRVTNLGGEPTELQNPRLISPRRRRRHVAYAEISTSDYRQRAIKVGAESQVEDEPPVKRAAKRYSAGHPERRLNAPLQR